MANEWVCPWDICNAEQAQQCRFADGRTKNTRGCGHMFPPETTPEQARKLIRPGSGAVQPPAPEPNNDEVICPKCCHQFRAIPVNVQRLMLDAGFEPPFNTAAQRGAALTGAFRERIAGAVARGWCHPDNEKKEMDAALAFAIIDEVLAALSPEDAGKPEVR